MVVTKPYTNFLADYRKRAGMTQKELGEKVDKSFASINRYENGTRSMDRELIIKVARILGVQPHELFVKPDTEG